MIQRTGIALRFYAFYVASKAGKTGLTVTCDVYENGSSIVTGASATEIGGGLYSYTLASGSNDANGEYAAIFKTSDGTVDAQHIPSLWVTPTWADAITSIKAKTDTIGAVSVSVVSPITTGGIINLVRGDDYLATDGRSIDFVYTGLTYSLIGATTITISFKSRDTAVVQSFTGAVLSASSVRVELTAAQTGGLAVGAHDYDIQATLSNGHIVTPTRGGTANVLQDYTP